MHLAETRGRDAWASHEAKQQAIEQAQAQVEHLAEKHYGGTTGFEKRNDAENVQAYKSYQESEHVRHHGKPRETVKLQDFVEVDEDA